MEQGSLFAWGETLQCAKCKERKPRADFSPDTRTRRGYQRECKACRRRYNSAERQRIKDDPARADAVRTYRREYKRRQQLDPVAKETIKEAQRRRYRERMSDPEYAARAKEKASARYLEMRDIHLARSREQYATNAEFRASAIARSAERSKRPDVKEAHRAYYAERYHNDPEYREQYLAKRRLKYATDPEYRARHNAAARAWQSGAYARDFDGRPRVYFIKAGEFIKIGFTTINARRRMATFQVGHPHDLVLLGVLDGTTERENEIHARFAPFHVRGEWFRAAPELIEFINDHARPDE